MTHGFFIVCGMDDFDDFLSPRCGHKYCYQCWKFHTISRLQQRLDDAVHDGLRRALGQPDDHDADGSIGNGHGDADDAQYDGYANGNAHESFKNHGSQVGFD